MQSGVLIDPVDGLVDNLGDLGYLWPAGGKPEGLINICVEDR